MRPASRLVVHNKLVGLLHYKTGKGNENYQKIVKYNKKAKKESQVHKHVNSHFFCLFLIIT